MEIKKSYDADLEHRRKTGFLLGLIVALSLFFVALEFTISPREPEADDDLLDEFAQDIEQLPALEQKDMVAAEQPQRVQPVSEMVREVKEVASPEAEREAASSAPPAPVSPVEVPERIVLDPTEVPALPLDMDDNPLKLRVVEDAPKPLQGWSQFMKWLHENLKYPPTARSQKIQGTVLVNFIVNIDGSVSDVKVAKSADPTLDREALRVVRMMPKWEPGVRNGQPARSMVGLPIVFKL